MDEFKVGDRVRLIPLLLNTGHQPDYGTVLRFVGEDIDVAWDNGPKRSLHLASRLQLAKPPSQLVFYVREITALHATLTKRNATIGRLRAANRELRRVVHSASDAPVVPPGVWTPELVKAFNSSPPKQPVEPAPLPTVPPQVGGVYRTRDGREVECTEENPDACESLRFTMLSKSGSGFAVYRSGVFTRGGPHGYDLVAEISPPPEPTKYTCETCGDETEIAGVTTCIGCIMSPKKKPPEPAFTGPLEVGGWYEDDVGGKWRCISIFLDEKTGEILAYCKKRNRVWFERFGLDGKPRPIVASAIVDTIIRKVDPPGGES